MPFVQSEMSSNVVLGKPWFPAHYSPTVYSADLRTDRAFLTVESRLVTLASKGQALQLAGCSSRFSVNFLIVFIRALRVILTSQFGLG